MFSHIISEVANFIYGHLIEVGRDISDYESKKGRPYIKSEIWVVGSRNCS